MGPYAGANFRLHAEFLLTALVWPNRSVVIILAPENAAFSFASQSSSVRIARVLFPEEYILILTILF